MPEYLAPGLYVEEIDSGSKPIEGVGINTAAFIGYAKSGEFNKPTFITNWSQFVQTFGEEENALMLALCQELNISVADVRAAKKASRKGWTEYANQAITRAVHEKKASVTSWQEFLQKHRVPLGGLPYRDGAYLAHAVRGYYDNGGSRAFIIRVAHPEDMQALSFSLEGTSKGRIAAKAAQVSAGPLLITASRSGAAGNDIKVEVEHVGDGPEFKLAISHGDVTERFPDAKGTPLTLETAPSVVNKGSKLVQVEVTTKTATAVRPVAQVYTLVEGSNAASVPAARTAGSTALAASPLTNGLSNLRVSDFVGDEAQRTGLGGLAPLEGVNFIAMPDLMAGLWAPTSIPGSDDEGPEGLVIDDKKQQEILDAQCALVAHCERAGYRMAILDPIPGLSAFDMNKVTLNTAYNCDHGQAAIYYPWVKIADPLRRGKQMFCPPSGHVAGVWSRVGVERGVHKAPANEALVGAVGLEIEVTKGEQELLNPNGINCIRAFPGRGIRVWGARTLATLGNPSWKYVNVRRLFNYLEESMDRSLQWVVFEPNDQDLWGRVRRNIAAFLFTEWKEGKLFGGVPAEAFYVKCDSETNPQEMIDLGRLYVEIGINPVKPAEFVIVRLGQWSGGGSLSET